MSDKINSTPNTFSVKLTNNQYAALVKANSRYGVWNKHADNALASKLLAPLQVLRKLEKMGLVEPINSGDTQWCVQYVTTEAGHTYLHNEALHRD